MKYKPSVILVDPKSEKEFERRVKKDGMSKSEFYRRVKAAYLQGQSLSSWVREKTKQELQSK